MFSGFQAALARNLSPTPLFWARTIKRAILGRPAPPRWPSPWNDAQKIRKIGSDEPLPGDRILQEVSIERITSNKIHAPYLFYSPDDVITLPAKEIARTLTLSASYINSVDIIGDVAEFGTMGGFTARTIAAAMAFDPVRQPVTSEFARERGPRKLHLFDSFKGLPTITDEGDLASPHVISGAWSAGGCKVLSARELRAMIEGIIPTERLVMHDGWFTDTVKKLPDTTRFAMIHFDGDLYSSTMDALDPCFARGFVSEGAVLCFDDWNCNRASPAYGERKAWSDLVARYNIVASNCGDYAVNSTRFIVHSYVGMPDNK